MGNKIVSNEGLIRSFWGALNFIFDLIKMCLNNSHTFTIVDSEIRWEKSEQLPNFCFCNYCTLFWAIKKCVTNKTIFFVKYNCLERSERRDQLINRSTDLVRFVTV
jgi:hypothetical protein